MGRVEVYDRRECARAAPTRELNPNVTERQWIMVEAFCRVQLANGLEARPYTLLVQGGRARSHTVYKRLMGDESGTMSFGQRECSGFNITHDKTLMSDRTAPTVQTS